MSGGGTYSGSNGGGSNSFPTYSSTPNYPQAFSPMDSGATFGNTTAPTNSSIANPPMMDMGATFGSANAPMNGNTMQMQVPQMMDAGSLFGSQIPQATQAPQAPVSGYSDAQVTNALRSYGQDPNSSSGQQWMQAIQSGQATPQDMIKALSSGQANPNFGQPVTPPMGAPQTPMQTKGIVLSEGPRMPARSLINFPNYGPNIPGNPPGNPTTPGNPTIPPSTPPNPITAPSGQRIPYTPYPGYPGLPPMPANNAPQFYGPSYLTDSITGKLFQMTPQFAQYRDALAGDPNSFRFN